MFIKPTVFGKLALKGRHIINPGFQPRNQRKPNEIFALKGRHIINPGFQPGDQQQPNEIFALKGHHIINPGFQPGDQQQPNEIFALKGRHIISPGFQPGGKGGNPPNKEPRRGDRLIEKNRIIVFCKYIHKMDSSKF